MRFLPLLALSILLGCGGDPEPAAKHSDDRTAAGGNGESRPKPRPEMPDWKNVRAPRKPENAWDIAAAVESRQLQNGLTVLVRERHGAPVITCQLAFKVGAVDERDKERGIAHFLEHMLFKGSTSFKKGEIDAYTAKNGGQNNAYTTRDMTTFHFTMPASGLDAALKILSEMLGQSTLDEAEFEAEKGPVCEELKAGLDNPWNRLWEQGQAEVFTKHPYHHPVIGYEPEIRKMTRAQMKEFYDKYYKPTNAVLVIVGDVDREAVFGKVQGLFKGIATGTPVPKLETVEPPQEKERRWEKEEDVEVDRLVMAWRGPAVGQDDDFACDILSRILGSGRTARLHRRLVEADRLASDIGASNDSGRFPGSFVVNVESLQGAARPKIEAAIDDEIAKLIAEGPTAEEMTRARNATIATFIFRAESSETMADALATFACMQDVEALGAYVGRIQAVRAEAVKDAAKRLLRREARTTCWSIAKGGDDKDGTGDASDGAAVKLTGAKRVVLDNGMILLLLENHDLPIFAVQTFARSGQTCESEDHAGLAHLVGELLADGTATRTAEQIAAAIENVGGHLSTSATGVDLNVVAKDQDLALDLTFDILENSSFPEEWVERDRALLLNDIAAKRDDPTQLAKEAFMEAVYAKHPLHRPDTGYEDTVKSLTRDDCVRHFKKFFVPNNTAVAIVGDFDAAKVESRIRELTKSWKLQLLDFPEFPAAENGAGGARGVALPDSNQVNVFLGHVGIRRNDPDYFPLLVLDHVLGTGSGFTDRMSRTVRDEKGLVYWIGASVASSAGVEPGTFRAGFACEPAHYGEALKMVRAEIDRIRKDLVPVAEMDAAKAYVTGSFALGVETDAQLADWLITVERYGLGLDYPDKFAARVNAVTPEQVLAAAQKHLDPKALWLVVSGPVDEKGELKKK